MYTVLLHCLRLMWIERAIKGCVSWPEDVQTHTDDDIKDERTGSIVQQVTLETPRKTPLITYAQTPEFNEKGEFVGFRTELFFPFGETEVKKHLEEQAKKAREVCAKEVKEYVEKSQTLAPKRYAMTPGGVELKTYAARLKYYFG